MVAAIEGADVVHLAGHFVAREGNGLLAQMLVGGRGVSGYDLLQLKRPPSLVVLSGCSTATAEQIGTNGSLGFADALLAVGCECVLATVAPLEDGPATGAVLGEIHLRVAQGFSPAAALADVRSNSVGREREVACCFVAFGRGL